MLQTEILSSNTQLAVSGNVFAYIAHAFVSLQITKWLCRCSSRLGPYQCLHNTTIPLSCSVREDGECEATRLERHWPLIGLRFTDDAMGIASGLWDLRFSQLRKRRLWCSGLWRAISIVWGGYHSFGEIHRPHVQQPRRHGSHWWVTRLLIGQYLPCPIGSVGTTTPDF